MEDNILKASELISQYELSRDNFILMLNTLEVQDEVTIYSKGTTYTIKSEEVDFEYGNKRKLYESVVNKRATALAQELTGADVSTTDLRVLKQVYRLQEKNNELNRQVKSDIKAINSSEEILGEIRDALKEVDFKTYAPKFTYRQVKDGRFGIFHLSDCHFDMYIDEVENKYDFNIASKRLRKHVLQSIDIMLASGVETVYVCNTGDTISSDRRQAELVNRPCSRAVALSISTKLIALALRELSVRFNVFYAGCAGNEAREAKDNDWDKYSMSDNFDIMIRNNLAMLFEDTNVTIIETDNAETIVGMPYGFTALLTHGANIPANGNQKIIQEIKGKYADRGVLVDYVLIGDKHATHISCLYSRGASLCGSNAYAGVGLNFSSRASQNCHIVSSDKSVQSFKNDVQNVDGVIGYDIENEINKFNIRLVK